MQKYYVVTPGVDYVDVVIPETGQGPVYHEREVIEIEAKSKRDAVILGVHKMLRTFSYKYCRYQRMDGVCPYTGVRAYAAQA